MGADIHMYVERRMPSGDWICVRDLNETLHSKGLNVLVRSSSPIKDGFSAFWNLVGRNYSLFAALAGVRGEGPQPRGLPQDVSEYVELERDGWGFDAHSVSWYSASDFVRIYEGVYAEVDDDTPLSEYVITRMEDGDEIAVARFLSDKAGVGLGNDDSVDNYRFVFWFDN